MKPVFWTHTARADLRSIRAYIARDSERYAVGVIARIMQAARRLEAFPDSGRLVPELEDDEVRQVIVGNYRVLYEHDDAQVRVLRVVHGARDYPPAE